MKIQNVRRLIIALLIPVIVCLAACKEDGRQTVNSGIMELADTYGGTQANGDAIRKAPGDPNVQSTAPAREARNAADFKQMLHIDGEIAFTTDNPDSARVTILAAIKKHDAYIARDEQFTHGKEGRHNSMTIRIPAQHFDAFCQDAVRGVKKLDRREIRVQDVTEEYLDLEARLKAKRELEQRYFVLLKRADSVEDILTIEQHLAAVRTEIERFEGKIRYLGNRSDYATLNIHFYTEYEYAAESESTLDQIGHAIVVGWRGALNVFVNIFYLWPLVMLGIGLLVYFRRKFRVRGATLQTAADE